MRKILFIVASVLLLMFVNPVYAEGEEVINMNVGIEKQSDCYVVTFPDSDVFSTSKPTMEVITDYTTAEVHKGSVNGPLVPSSISNGKVSFTVSDSGVYYITEPTEPSTYPYAILLNNGDLIFFRTAEVIENSSTKTVTINETSYTGKVFANVESTSNQSVPWDNFRSSIKRAYVAQGFTISPVSLDSWFADCLNLTAFDFAGFDLTNCKDIGQLFVNCSSLTTISNFNTFNTSNVQYFDHLFNGCTSLSAQNLSTMASQINTGSAKMLEGMFANTNVESLDLSHFNTSNVEYFDNMFSNCKKLTVLNISSFDTSGALIGSEKMDNMFKDCDNLSSITLGANFKKNQKDDLCLTQGNWKNTTTSVIKTETTLFELNDVSGTWVLLSPEGVPEDITVTQSYGGKVKISSNDGEWISKVNSVEFINDAGEVIKTETITNPSGKSISISIRTDCEKNYFSEGKTYSLSIKANGYETAELNNVLTIKQNINLTLNGNGGIYKLDSQTEKTEIEGALDTCDTSGVISGTLNDFKSAVPILYTDPIMEGYEFVGYYDDPVNGTYYVPDQTIIDDDLILYAHWNEETYKVIYDNNGGSGEIQDGSRKYSEAYTLATESSFNKDGYSLDGWTWKGVKVTAIPAKTAEDATVMAIWKENSYKVKYEANGASGTQPDDTRKYTQEFTLPVYGTDAFKLTYKGHDFVGWTLGENTVTKIGPDVASDVTVTAQWAENKKTVKLYVDGTLFRELSVLKDYTLADAENYAEPGESGLLFVSWIKKYNDGTADAYTKDSVVTEDLELHAQFAQITPGEADVPEYKEGTQEKEVAKNVINTNIDGKEVTKAASELITKERSEKAVEALKLKEGESVDDVTVIVETNLEMKVTKTSGEGKDINSFIVDITPRFKITAVYEKGEVKRTADITPENNKLDITKEEVELTIYLPDSFKEGDRVWIKHGSSDVFGGDTGFKVTLIDGMPCVTYKHKGGFSPFEISKVRLYPDVKPQPAPSHNLPKTGIE